MSAGGITDTAVKAIEQGEFDAIIMNYANPTGGHSGKLEAAIKAVEAVDGPAGTDLSSAEIAPEECGLSPRTRECGDDDRPVSEGPHTYHTTNPVPIISGE